MRRIGLCVLIVRKEQGSKIVQITKVHERRSESNVVNMLHPKQLTIHGIF